MADVYIQPNLQNDNSVRTKNLGGPGFISQASAIAANEQIQTLSQLRNDMIDYIRLRLGDQIVDVERQTTSERRTESKCFDVVKELNCFRDVGIFKDTTNDFPQRFLRQQLDYEAIFFRYKLVEDNAANSCFNKLVVH